MVSPDEVVVKEPGLKSGNDRSFLIAMFARAWLSRLVELPAIRQGKA